MKETVGRITFGDAKACYIGDVPPWYETNTPGPWQPYNPPYPEISPFDILKDLTYRPHNHMHIIDTHRTRNVSDTVKMIDVKAAGFTVNEIEMVIDKGVITVKMEKKESDHFYARNTLSFTLENGEKFKEATLERGILSIEVTREAKPKPKKITIKQK